MLRKRKEPRAKKSVAEALLRDMQGTAAEKLALFEKLKARGGFSGENRAELSQGRADATDVCGDREVICSLRTLKAGHINGNIAIREELPMGGWRSDDRSERAP